MSFLKRWMASPELKKLERYELAMQLAQRWMASLPEASAALRYIDDVVEGRESPNTISNLQHVLLDKVGRLAEKLNEREKFEAELDALHAKYAHMRLKADTGWKRYEQANAKYKEKEYEVTVLTEKLEEFKDYAFRWYAALVKCAIYLNIPVGHSITEAPAKLKTLLKYRRFIFINEPKDDWPPLTKTAMVQAVANTQQIEYLMPGVPCKGCDENCCTLNRQHCVLAKTRSPT
jgi:hypothetical protein